MNGQWRILFRAARAMISDGVIVSGLVVALVGDAYVWRESGNWLWPVVCLALQLAAMVVIAMAGEYWRPTSKERSCGDVECGTAGTERTSSRTA